MHDSTCCGQWKALVMSCSSQADTVIHLSAATSIMQAASCMPLPCMAYVCLCFVMHHHLVCAGQMSEATNYGQPPVENGLDPRYPEALPLPRTWDPAQNAPEVSSTSQGPRPWWEVSTRAQDSSKAASTCSIFTLNLHCLPSCNLLHWPCAQLTQFTTSFAGCQVMSLVTSHAQ